MKKTKITTIFFILVILLLFLKSDFRVINELNCCQDDYDYYSHALTIAQDFDFDYSNQLVSGKRFYLNGKDAPKGFLGSGLLASPFLFFGILLDKLFGESHNILTYKKLLYSFSSVFYLFFSLNLIKKSIDNKLETKTLILAFFGSGVAYFAFERFSMTHVYEVFTVSLIIYLTIKYYSDENSTSIFSLFLPLSFLLGFLVRWTNYYILFIPFIILKITFKGNAKKYILKDPIFLVSSALSLGLFSYLSKAIYGVVTFSPTFVYQASNISSNLVNELNSNFFNVFLKLFKDTYHILFTQEFGLVWFSPVIFLGLLMTCYALLFSPTNKFAYFVILLCYGQSFFVVSLWTSTASSYGFRYLYSLIPLSFYVLTNSEGIDRYPVFIKYLKYSSIFSILSILFFESTTGTQLSTEVVINSFGIEDRYSQPYYLTGFIESLTMLTAYLKIFATSFLGLFSFIFLLITIGSENLNLLLKDLGLSFENKDFVDLLSSIEIIEIHKFILILLICIYICNYFYEKIISD